MYAKSIDHAARSMDASAQPDPWIRWRAVWPLPGFVWGHSIKHLEVLRYASFLEIGQPSVGTAVVEPRGLVIS